LTVEALEDRTLPSLTLVSANAAGTDGANGGSLTGSVSADGRFVAFTSSATDLVSGFVDGNGSLNSDVYVRNLQTGVTVLVSHSSTSPTRGGNDGSETPAISADGRFVAFVSRATDLVPGFNPNGGAANVYVCNLQTGAITLVSRSTAGAATGGNGNSDFPAISADGGVVAFGSSATDLVPGFVDGNGIGHDDVYRRDLQTGVTTLVSHSTASPTQGGNDSTNIPILSADGRFVAFDSGATDLVAGFISGGLRSSNVFVNDGGGPTTLVSHRSAGPTTGGNGISVVTSMSATGQFLVFESDATDLDSTFVNNNGGGRDVFLSNVFAGIISLISHNPSSPHSGANETSDEGVISADGRFVAFASVATDLIPGFVDSNGSAGPDFDHVADVFLRDVLTGSTTLVSHSTAGPTVGGNGGSFAPVVGDGGVVGFSASPRTWCRASPIPTAPRPSTRTCSCATRSAGSPRPSVPPPPATTPATASR
jgi:Tol biopolymer transport system component